MGPRSDEELDLDYLGEDDNSTRLLSMLPDEDFFEEDNSDRPPLAKRASARQLSGGCPAGVHAVDAYTFRENCLEEALKGKRSRVVYSKFRLDECWYSRPQVGSSRRRFYFCRQHGCKPDFRLMYGRACRHYSVWSWDW